MALFAKFRAAIIWGKMRQMYLDGEIPAAVALAEEYRKLGVRSPPVFLAFDATLGTLDLNSESALAKFKILAETVSKSSRVDSRYIYEYCMYQIGMIENDRDSAERHRSAAKSLHASKFVTNSLPIMDEPLPQEWFS